MVLTHSARRILISPGNCPAVDYFSGGLTTMPENYYVILGIPSDSTQAEIKAAYRKLAKKFHPDHHKVSPAPFQGIQEAYSVLGNPKSRKSYDSSLQSRIRIRHPADVEPMQQYFTEQEVEPLVNERRPGPIEINSLNRSIHGPRAAFDHILDRFLGDFTEPLQSAQRRRQDITIEVTLSKEQSRRGGTVRILVPVEMQCPTCCRSGSSRYYTCRRCNGVGTLRGDKPLIISYPPGINNNNSMELTFNRAMSQPLHLTVVFTVR